jgi:mono/diheme cytochrome c family protein
MMPGRVLLWRSLSAPVTAATALTVLMVCGRPAVHAQGGGAARPSSAPSQAAAAPAGNAEKGKQLYQTYFCHACHGTEGQGGAGARIAPNPPAFNAFRNYLRKPAGSMPPYTSKALPDPDLQDIHAYLRSIPPAQPARNIPLLNQ